MSGSGTQRPPAQAANDARATAGTLSVGTQCAPPQAGEHAGNVDGSSAPTWVDSAPGVQVPLAVESVVDRIRDFLVVRKRAEAVRAVPEPTDADIDKDDDPTTKE